MTTMWVWACGAQFSSTVSDGIAAATATATSDAQKYAE